MYANLKKSQSEADEETTQIAKQKIGVYEKMIDGLKEKIAVIEQNYTVLQKSHQELTQEKRQHSENDDKVAKQLEKTER